MSMSHYVYVGPYIMVEQERGKMCWGDYEDKYYTSEEPLTEAIDDSSDDAVMSLLVPNVDRNPPRGFEFFKDEGDTWDEFSSNTIQEEVNWLRYAFEKEIADIIDVYGVSHVRVCWGVISYFR